MNQINSDPSKAPKTVNEIYVEAMTWLSYEIDQGINKKGATFATGDGLIKTHNKGKRSPRGGAGNEDSKVLEKATDKPDDSKAKSTPNPSATEKTDTTDGDWLKKIECFNCNEKGHMARNCPKKANFTGMTRQSADYMPSWYEIRLDSISQVNVVNSRFLSNIRRSSGSYAGLSGSNTATTLEGDLEYFFPCQIHDVRTTTVRIDTLCRVSNTVRI